MDAIGIGTWTLDDLILAAARAGYAARGIVYLAVGGFALMAALQLRSDVNGSRDSILAFAQAPLGVVWMAAVAAGLVGFASWRALQAVFDADRQGRGAKALVSRAGQAISGLIYGGLALSILELLDELESVSAQDEEQEAQREAAMLMSLPYGDIALILVGLFIIAAGVGNIHHGARRRFRSDLDCSAKFRTVAKQIGRLGYMARGIAFSILGVILAKAGFVARSSEAKGLGGAMEALRDQPGGALMLALIALGLMAFGAFGLIEARYRVLHAPDV